MADLSISQVSVTSLFSFTYEVDDVMTLCFIEFHHEERWYVSFFFPFVGISLSGYYEIIDGVEVRCQWVF